MNQLSSLSQYTPYLDLIAAIFTILGSIIMFYGIYKFIKGGRFK